MVLSALQYVENKADKIYIYCSYEPKMYSFKTFYKINNCISHNHKLNDYSDYIYDVSIEKQKILIRSGSKYLQEYHKLCQKYDEKMPTEIKIIYEVEKDSLEVDYKYDLIYSLDDVKMPYHIFNEWFDEIKKQEEEN
jgi:hypothetical protein